MRMKSKNLLGACVLGLWVTACGDDEPAAHGDHDAGHDHHDSGHQHGDGDGHGDAGDHHHPGDDLDVPCPENLPELAVGTLAEGTEKRIHAKVVKVDPLPLGRGTSDWELRFQTQDGEPLTDITVTRAYTYMPVHDHDGTFEPKVSPLDEAGHYEFDGFNFTMRGPWQVRIDLSSDAAGDDHFILDVCVEPE